MRPADTEAYGTELVALDLATGAVAWRLPVAGTYYWSALAYGDGRLYLVNFNGQLTALAPATGAALWSVKLSQSSFSTPPVAFDGDVYLTGSGSGSTVYAVRGSDGAVVWSKELPSGSGTPAVDASTVHVSMACQHAMAFDRASGAVRWEHHGDCTGGGEGTPALHGGRMYPLSGNPAIYDAATGAVAGTAGVGTPAFADGTAYFAAPTGGVFAVDAANWAPRWAAAIGGGSEAPRCPRTTSTSAPRRATSPRSHAPTASCAGARRPACPCRGRRAMSTGLTPAWAQAAGCSSSRPAAR